MTTLEMAIISFMCVVGIIAFVGVVMSYIGNKR